MTAPRYPVVLSHYYFIIILALIFAVIAIGLIALSLGSTHISVFDIPRHLLTSMDSIDNRIINEIRLPRVLSGFCVGGLLALAGCLMQVLLRNPLAEPYILGVSGGASAFALIALYLGLTGHWINLSAFTGAVLTILLVFYLSGARGKWNPLKTLLTGVVLAAGWGAIISFLLTISPETRVHGMLFWLMGDLSLGDFSLFSVFILVVSFFACLFFAKELNLLAMGQLTAQALGVSTEKLTYIIYFLSSLLTATAVMQAGSIGFIGLIVPHLSRLCIGSDHRILIPVAVLAGGCLLVISDSLARTIIAPHQLPVGILTAMLGVPVFLILLNAVNNKRT
ncbi:MAG: iron ABC transporter permease [Gammaproteobacteria bacterium]|nr:iron ABC transporter permease [Gammaproteobacteria bacterium]